MDFIDREVARLQRLSKRKDAALECCRADAVFRPQTNGQASLRQREPDMNRPKRCDIERELDAPGRRCLLVGRSAGRNLIDFELRHFGMPSSAFIAGDTPMFEQITSVEGQFNRALLYRGWQLHSGAIGPRASLSPNPNKGRLTVTTFLTVG